jgi:hypothetical protein
MREEYERIERWRYEALQIVRQRDELADALRELTNACEDMRRNYGEDQNANVRCSHAQDGARVLLARIDAENVA